MLYTCPVRHGNADKLLISGSPDRFDRIHRFWVFVNTDATVVGRTLKTYLCYRDNNGVLQRLPFIVGPDLPASSTAELQYGPEYYVTYQGETGNLGLGNVLADCSIYVFGPAIMLKNLEYIEIELFNGVAGDHVYAYFDADLGPSTR